MSVFKKIESIRISNKLNVKDFIEKTGISRTAYYALKNGGTKKINIDTAMKLVEVFPEYEVEYFLLSNDYSKNLKCKELSESELNLMILKYKNEIVNNTIIKEYIELEVEKKLNKILKNYINEKL